uniref:Uncharacterized protein n=2 Tax=Rhodnius prolixus TaxID=13249 RepID=T1I9E1_RHOPR
MRIKIAKILVLLVIILNLIVFYFVWFLVGRQKQPNEDVTIKKIRSAEWNDVQANITVILRGFESFENDIPNTVRSIASTYPNISILIVTDTPPYPPLFFNSSLSLFQNVRLVNLQPGLNNSFEARTPLFQLSTEFVLFMPDSTRIHTKKTIEKMLRIITNERTNLVAVAATYKASKPVTCLNCHINLREWIIQFEESSSDVCDFVRGKHATLLRTEMLRKLTDPFMLPFPDSFYIQAATHRIKTHILRELPFGSGKELYGNPHSAWKANQLSKERAAAMYHALGLKKVMLENGDTEWHGCRRDTARCFGTVVDDTPQYLWEGKWTPPCCLAGLRRTARHVFHLLDQAQTRYWLEGGSLLGAMRMGDILPWDYDVDVGIYSEDIGRCSWLVRAKTRPAVDEQGFVWEKASEGDFFRVHLSQVNRLHVDIFPFEVRNGTMTKGTWLHTHKQDMEFPQHFLKPLSTIEFVGRTVSAPNNIHDFLELKFGKGAIENPVYPNPSKMAIFGLK